MEAYQKFSGERTGYDARKGFSELLIDTIRAMFYYNNKEDLQSWEMFCRNYYSTTKKYIDTETQQECEALMQQIVNAKFYRKGKRMILIAKWYNNDYCRNKVTILLMQLQQELIQSTTHLLTPTKETDEENFNPDGVV